jgi:ribosomal protein L12E/L44/L45/RPP1/RPP2
VFGSTAFVHVPSQRRQKLDAVAEKGVFLGYEANTKGYRILRERDKRVVVSKDVTFQEEEIRADSFGDFLEGEDRERSVTDGDKPLALTEPTTSGAEPMMGRSTDSEGEREVEEEENEGRREETIDELGGARGLSRVSPLDSSGAGATPTGEASTRVDPERSRRARKPSTLRPRVRMAVCESGKGN